ncbi:MAG: hypothetical protein ACOX4A_10295 [Saccharofermentanales bacterium]
MITPALPCACPSTDMLSCRYPLYDNANAIIRQFALRGTGVVHGM